MNGYQITIDAYKQVLESGRTDVNREFIESKIKALEPFAERNEEERIMLFDSGAFNDVMNSYCRVAMQNCNVGADVISGVMGELNWLLDTVGANEILKK